MKVVKMKSLKSFFNSWPKILVILVLVGGVAVTIGGLGRPNVNTSSTARGLTIAVVEPTSFTALALNGKALFGQYCVSCHGTNASGTDNGPPLVHDLYNPGHHADESFLRAAQNGVRSHHWPYGNMPPVDGIGAAQVRAITAYVRELQVANGISWRPHTM
jgi:mono/diheme cytochrome c family protein